MGRQRKSSYGFRIWMYFISAVLISSSILGGTTRVRAQEGALIQGEAGAAGEGAASWNHVVRVYDKLVPVVTDNVRISPDGRFVAFISYKYEMGPAGGGELHSQLVLYDRETGTLEEVLRDVGPKEPVRFSMSADARFFAYAGKTRFMEAVETQVYVYDRSEQELTLVSKRGDGLPPTGMSGNPSISADGRFIAYDSMETDIVATDSSENFDVFVYDRITGQTEHISQAVTSEDPDEISWGHSERPSISADGRYVAFESSSAYLVEGDENGNTDVFLYDRMEKKHQLISISASGSQSTEESGRASISGDGSIVAFESYGALVDGDTNGERDIYVYRKAEGTIERISVAPGGGQNAFESFEPLISADGKFVAYETAPDTVDFDKAMVADLTTRTTLEVDVSKSEETLTLPLTNLALSAGANVAAFNAAYTVIEPQSGEEFPMVGLFIASKVKDVPPTWPAGSKLEGSDVQSDQATLAWTPALHAKGVKAYRIYANNERIGTVDGSVLSYTATGLLPATSYVFRVEAVNGDDVQSSGGPTVSLTTEADDQTLTLSLQFDRMSTHRLPVPDSTLTIGAKAKTGRTVSAVVAYSTWLDDSGERLPAPKPASKTVSLSETPAGSGNYVATFAISEGVSALTLVTATMTGAAGGPVERQAAGLPVAIGGNLKVEFDNPGGVSMDNARLTVFSLSRSSYKVEKVNDETPITIEGLAPAADYKLMLTGPDGKTLSQQMNVNVEAGLTETLTMSIVQPAQYRFKVTDQDGKSVTGIKIELWDETGATLLAEYQSDASGHTAWTQLQDHTPAYKAKIILQETNYDPLPDMEISLKPGENEIPIVVQRSAEGKLKGKVLNPEGKPVFNALVTTTQIYKGKPVVQQTYSDLNGAYEVTLFAGEAAVQAAQTSYHYNSEEGLQATIAKGTTTTYDIPVKMFDRGMVVLQVYVKMIGGEWQGPIDMAQMAFKSEIYAKFGAQTSYFQNAVHFQGQPGENVNVCVSGALHTLVNACETIRLDDNANGVAEFRIEEKGGLIQGNIAANTGAWTYVNLYEVVGNDLRYASSESFRTSNFSLHAPKAGTYRLEFHRRDARTNKQETAFKQITIKDRETMNIGSISLLPSAYFGHVTANGFIAQPNEVSPGGTVNLRAFYQNGGENTVDNAVLKIELPNGLAPVADASGTIPVKIGGTASTAALNGNVIEIALGALVKKATGTVTLQAKLDAGYSLGKVQLNARIEGNAGEVAISETLGYVQLEVPKVTLEAPDRVADASFTAVGLAPAGSRVNIYDDNLLLGSVVASAAGTWQSAINLVNVDGSGTHLLWAKAESGGRTLQSERKIVLFEQDQPILQEVAMAQYPNGKWLRFDAEKGIAALPYTVVPGNPFAFQLKFSQPDKVKNVKVYLGGQIGGPVTAERGTDGLFRATVPTTTGALGGVYIDYDTIKPKVVVSREVPTEEETRNALPAKMKDFKIVGKTPFSLDGSVYSGSASFEFPQLPNMRLDAKMTIDVSSNDYRPTVEEIVEAEATGILMYNASFEVKETANGVVAKMTGYVPRTVLIPAGKSGGKAKSLAAFSDFDPLEVLDEMGIDPGPYKSGMIQVSTEYAMIAKNAADPISSIKEQYTGYRDYAGKINKIMSNVEASSVCPENMEMTGEQAGKALLVTVGGEVAKTAIGAWTGAMMLEGPVGFIGGYAGKYVSNKIDSYVDEQIDKIKTVGPTSPDSCTNDSYYDDPEEENIYKKRLKRIARMKWIYDPSGYVYEAVESNRLEGVKATVLYKDPVSVVWKTWDDARAYDQINPQFTDKEGRYGWDVPEGLWKVVWEKIGYEPASSAELAVPPPHFDVNAGMVSKASPFVKGIEAIVGDGGSFIDISFSKYLRAAAAIPAGEITVTGPGGTVVEGAVTYAEAQAGVGSGEPLSRKIRFTPAGSLTEGADYTIKIEPRSIVSYAGTPMLDGEERTVKAVLRDTSGPTLTRAEALSGNTVIKLVFDEALSTSAGLLDPAMFEIAGANGSAVLSAVAELPEGAEQPTAVVLSLSRPFAEGASVTIHAKAGAVSDLLGNPSGEKSLGLAGPNPMLSQLSVVGGTLTEPFSAGKTDYTLKIGEKTSSIQLKATLAEAGGKLFIRGVPLADATPKTIGIPSDGIIAITVQAANRPDIMKEYKLTVQRSTGPVDPGPGSDPGPAQGGGSGSVPPVGDAADIGRDAKISSVMTSDGRKGAVIEVNAESVRLALKSVKAGDELHVKAPGGYDSYEVRLPVEAFRDLAKAQAIVRLQTGSLSFLVQPDAWTESLSDKATAVHLVIARASVLDEEKWIDALRKKFGGFSPQTGLYRFAVEAAEGDRAVALTWPKTNAAGIAWKTGNQSGETGVYGYDPTRAEWRFIGSVSGTLEQSLPFGAVDSSYLAVMTYGGAFKDISDHWAKEAIDWMAARLYVNGISRESFKPDRQVTRAEFAAMLTRIFRVQPSSGDAPAFSDVKPGDWYYDAVRAAAAAKLIKGDSHGKFNPDAYLTREQMTVLVWRAYSQLVGEAGQLQDGELQRLLQSFKDASAIKNWSKADVAAAVQAGLVQGGGAGRFNPNGIATRGQAVTILRKLAEKLEQQ